MMRVLHIIDSLYMGGAETWLLEVVKATHVEGSDFPRFDFLLAGGEKAIFDDVLQSYGCRLHYIKLDSDNVFSFIRNVRCLLQREKYSAVHDHQDFLAGWHFLFCCRLLPPIRIVHFHNPFFQMRENYGINANRRMKLAAGAMLLSVFSTHIFGTSAKLLQEYGVGQKEYPRQVVGPFYCAFSLKNFLGSHKEHKKELCSELGIDSNVPLVLFAGRFDQSLEIGHPQNHKNSVYAVEIVKEFPECHMVMVGKNDHVVEAFRAMLMDRGMSDRVHLLGIRKDIAHIMLGCDVLLFPSRAEGMGMVAVEAQAAGLPVVASEAVPKEVVVLDEKVSFIGTGRTFKEWAKVLREVICKRSPGDTIEDLRWANSPFNLRVCCDNLRTLYTGRWQG